MGVWPEPLLPPVLLCFPSAMNVRNTCYKSLPPWCHADLRPRTMEPEDCGQKPLKPGAKMNLFLSFFCFLDCSLTVIKSSASHS